MDFSDENLSHVMFTVSILVRFSFESRRGITLDFLLFLCYFPVTSHLKGQRWFGSALLL